jgi:DNA polymerase (family X)
MDKHEAAFILEQIAQLLEIQRENPFKGRAYRVAARALEDLDEDLERVVAEGRLLEISGIGASIADKITMLVSKGSLPFYEKLKASIPRVLIELMDVPGLGAKKARILYEKLNICSVEDLAQACAEGKIASLRGFGLKTQENIARSISKLKAYGKRTLWWKAGKIAFAIVKKLCLLKEVEKAEIAGSFRRRLETIGDLDFLAASSNPASVVDWFIRQPWVEEVLAEGLTLSSVRLKGGMRADLRILSLDEFPFALIHFTGSKDFNIQLRQRALSLGYSLSEYALTPIKKQKKKAPMCSNEAKIFHFLNLEYIPPELREGHLEMIAAEQGRLPDLIEEKDIKGAFHCHTTYSDGHNTLEEMVAAACEFGWEYLGISDHSKSSYQANGMDEEKLFEQISEIKKINSLKKYPVHVFAGLECDILNDGSLDFPNDVLKVLDFVICSIHRSFNLDEKKMTARLIRAIENPYTTMVGHVSGRLLLRREPYALDLPKVIDACIANHKIIELNAYPDQLDMDWRFWHKASEKGLLCSINPGAHSTYDLRYYLAGVNVARKGWLTKKHVLTAWPLSQVRERLRTEQVD